MRDLHGRVVVITGAASGIGRATAQRLAREGARLVVCDVDADGLASLAAELGSSVLLSQRADVSDPAAVQALADATHALVPHIDVLVNNAGVGFAGSFTRTTADDFAWIIGVNLAGPAHLMRAFLPPMIARGHGHIVNVVSALGFFAIPGVSLYCATKHGLLGLTLSLRGELAPKGIGVSAVCPGVVNTNIPANTRVRGSDESGLRADLLKRFGGGHPPALIAGAVLDAIHRDRAIVPVGPEAWMLWGLSRVAPAVGAGLAKRLAKDKPLD